MTMISNYYAQVGVGIDRGSLAQVSRYLQSIERQFRGFQTRISRSTTISLTPTINDRGLRDRLRRLWTRQNGLRIDVSISQNSLNAMRSQVRQALNGLIVNPTINPRVNNPRNQGAGGGGGSGGGGQRSRADRLTTRNPSSVSPWHNPMMIGGGVGAFMRYGAFSLPFVAGTMGLNALSNRAATLQNQSLMMDVSMGALGGPGESEAQKKFLNDLGNRLGRTTESMTPFYAQMLSGAKGTDLEPHLQEGFASLMEFGSVMGLGSESMKGTIKAFTQMIL